MVMLKIVQVTMTQVWIGTNNANNIAYDRQKINDGDWPNATYLLFLENNTNVNNGNGKVASLKSLSTHRNNTGDGNKRNKL